MINKFLIFSPFFLSWGSFLNVASCRLIKGESLLFPRSYCPHCHTQIAWYDNVPLLSWLLLAGKCRACKHPISLLYPFIELLTCITLVLLFDYAPTHYFLGYFILFSALLVTIRSDLETMLISRFVTLYIIPVGFVLSYFEALPISFFESFAGAVFGYTILWSIAALFKATTGKEGMGEGDMELLACIGSFIGPLGCWATLLLASLVGSVVGIFYCVLYKRNTDLRIPFGPYLALGAMLFVLCNQQLFDYLLT